MSVSAYKYRIVDVFTQHALEGNALAVFIDATGMDTARMQAIAREMNLSETTFVVPATHPDCALGVRIFTARKEMEFAGHPTIGTAFVLRDAGLIPRDTRQFALQEKVGPVQVRIDAGAAPLIWLRTPPIRQGRVYQRPDCARALGLEVADLLEAPPQQLSAGNPTIFVPLRNREAVDRAWLDSAGMTILKGADAEPACVFVFTPTAQGAYSRMFAPEYGVVEDPATGSSTGPLAAFMIRHGMVSGASGTGFVSEQGTRMGRRSFLHVHILGADGKDGIEVGGHVVPVATATLTLEDR